MRCTAQDIEKRTYLGLCAAPMVENIRTFHQPKVPQAGLNRRKCVGFLKQVADPNSHLNSRAYRVLRPSGGAQWGFGTR